MKTFNIGSMKTFNIGSKLAAGFGALVVLTLILGVVNIVANNIKSAALERLLNSEEGFHVGQKIEEELLQARRREKDFLLRYTAEGIQTAHDTYVLVNQGHTQAIHELIAEARALEGELGHQEHLDDLNEMEEVVSTYERLFAQVVSSIEERGFKDTGLEGQFRQAAHALEDLPATQANPELQVLLLQMRRHEKDWTLRKELDDAETVRTFGQQLKNQLQVSDLTVSEKAEATALVDAYLPTFDQVVTLDLQIVEDIDEFRSAAHKVSPLVEEFTGRRQEEAAQALAQFRRIENLTHVAILALLAVVVITGIGLAVLVARSIIGPITHLTTVTEQVAAGDLTARASVASGDETEILAARFNQMASQLHDTLEGLEQRVAERTRELEASQRVTFAASQRTNPDMLLNLVVNLIRDQFHLYHAQVYIVEEHPLTSPPLAGGTEGGKVAVLRQSTGYAGRRLLQRKHHIPLNQPALVTKAINEGQPVVVDDVSQTADWLPNPLLPDTRSEMVVPLKVGDRVIGALDVQDRVPGRFPPDMVTLFQTMTDQVAFLFENSDLIERVTERTQALTIFTDQLRTAADIARRLGGILDPERLLQQVVELIRSRFGLYHAHIYVLEAPPPAPPVGTGGETFPPLAGGIEGGQRLVVRAGSGEVGRVLCERGHSISLDAKRSLVARAARAREPVLVEDTTLDSDFMPNPLLPQTRSEMAVPLIAGDKVLGVLDVQDDQAGRFTQAERDTFATLAGQIATALQTAGLYAQVQARFRVSQALAGAQTEEEVIAGMMAVASFYPQAQVVLALYDQEAEEPTIVARRVSSFESGVAPVEIGTRFPTSRFKLVDHLSPDEPLVISNLSTDERVDPTTQQFLTGLGVVSTVIINITAGDEQIGVLRASSAQEGYFDERKLHLYQSIAEQGAIALHTGRLFDETQRAAEELREMDRLKSEFMANMSHELRTPLNSIIGYTEIMLMGIDGAIDPDTYEDVQAIHSNGRRLLNMINDILDMAKIEAGSLMLNFEENHVGSVMDDASSAAARLLADKPIELIVEVEDDLPSIWGDRMRLDQILSNLVSNAGKFTEEGSIALRAYAGHGDGDWVCIEVADTGMGVSEADVAKIFDRFQQVDGSSTRRAGGTGLGLAITRHLVELTGHDRGRASPGR